VVSHAVEDVGAFVWNADDLLAAPEPACLGGPAAVAALLALRNRPR
jgi:hypothetical protein